MATTYDDAKKHILYENKEENLHKLQFCPQFPSMFIKNGIQNRIFLQKNLVNSHFMFIFASTEPATPLNNAHQGGAFLYIYVMEYTKLPLLSIADQIALLKSRGLAFVDETNAAQVLEHISYYRFAAYLRPMESDKTTHQLHTGALFEDVIALYEFDAKLRA